MTDHAPIDQPIVEILNQYNPLEIKDILLNGSWRKAVHHKDWDDVLAYYQEYDSYIHHYLLDSHFDGYMVTDANGCWKSAHELTKQVSIETDDRQAIDDVVQLYKEMFDQDAVGLYITPSMEFI